MNELEKLRLQIRNATAPVDLDDLFLIQSDARRVPVALPASIEIKGNRLVLWLRKSRAMPLPPEIAPLLSRVGTEFVTVTPADCYAIEAQTANAIAVRLEGVSPCSINVPVGLVAGCSVAHFDLSFESMHLVAEGMDALDRAGRAARFAALSNSYSASVVSDAGPAPIAYDELNALIPNVSLELANAGLNVVTKHPFFKKAGSRRDSNCLIGEIANGEYCLEATGDRDLAVYFRREVNKDQPMAPARQVLNGLLTAVGFLHGCNPWPYYLEHRRDGRMIERWIKAPADCQRDCLEPMELELFSREAEQLFNCAAEFFARGGDDADYFRRALWLMREANRKGAAFEVRLLTLCSVLEGVAKRHTESKKQIGDEASWQTAISRVGLDWAGWFGSVYACYCTYRNDLAHGFDPHPIDERSPRVVFNAYSRITGGIYILMAKRMGFTGRLWRSRLEGRETVSLS